MVWGNEDGALGAGVGQLNDPRGVWISQDGAIFIADADNDRISVWRAVVRRPPSVHRAGYVSAVFVAHCGATGDRKTVSTCASRPGTTFATPKGMSWQTFSRFGLAWLVAFVAGATAGCGSKSARRAPSAEQINTRDASADASPSCSIGNFCDALDDGVTFRSIHEHECGLGPADAAVPTCQWWVSFEDGAYDWRYSDYGETGSYFSCSGNTFRARSDGLDDAPRIGTWDPSRCVLTWGVEDGAPPLLEYTVAAD